MQDVKGHKKESLRAGRRVLAFVLCLACALSLCGCKYSDVLTQKIIGDPGEYEIDYSLPPISLPDPDAITASGYTSAESDQINELEIDHKDPTYDENPTTDEQTKQSPQSSDDSNLPSTGEISDGEDGDQGGEQGGSEGDALIPGDEGENGESADPNPDDESNDPSGSDVGNNGPGTFTDGSDYTNLPYAKKVAAAGQYATIVQSLCGKGGLVATNGQWLSDMQSKGAYPGELDGVTGIAAWGDGTTMNEDVVQAIIASGADTVLTSNTYGGVTQAYLQEFINEGINVVVMPTIGVTDALDADISNTVKITGALFEDAQESGDIQFDAPAKATRWQQVRQACIDGTFQARGTTELATLLINGSSYNWVYQGGYGNSNVVSDSSSRVYAAFIDSWDDSYSGNTVLSRVCYGYNVWPAGEWEPPVYNSSQSNVDDVFVGGIGKTVGSSYKTDSFYHLYQYYFQIAGMADTRLSLKDSSLEGSGIDAGPLYGLGNLWCSQLDMASGSTNQDKTVFKLGDDAFPALIVRNASIADKVKTSASYADQASGKVGAYNYGSNYGIIIMPEGVSGNWVDGTFESCLMIPYIYAGVLVSSGNLPDVSSCDSYIQTFYNEFYRCTDFTSLVQSYGSIPMAK